MAATRNSLPVWLWVLVGAVLSCGVFIGIVAVFGDRTAAPVTRLGCVPGQQLSCPCPDGIDGAQTCGATGQMGPCSCGTTEPLTVADAGPELPTPEQIILRTARWLATRRGDEQVAELIRLEEQASDVSYAQLRRNASSHNSKLVVYRGQVLEIADNDDFGSSMRVGIRRVSGRFWDDPVFVVSVERPDERIVEDSVVRVYGVLSGDHSYVSQAGWQITIPKVLGIAVVPDSVPRRLSDRARAALPPRTPPIELALFMLSVR